MKTLTLEDYQRAGEEFFQKYWYVAKELGEDAKPEQVLKVMEAVGGIALKLSLEDKLAPFGFNKRKMISKFLEAFEKLGWDPEDDIHVEIGGTSVYEIEGAGTKWAPVKGTRKYNKDAFIVIKNRSRNPTIPSVNDDPERLAHHSKVEGSKQTKR